MFTCRFHEGAGRYPVIPPFKLDPPPDFLYSTDPFWSRPQSRRGVDANQHNNDSGRILPLRPYSSAPDHTGGRGIHLDLLLKPRRWVDQFMSSPGSASQWRRWKVEVIGLLVLWSIRTPEILIHSAHDPETDRRRALHPRGRCSIPGLHPSTGSGRLLSLQCATRAEDFKNTRCTRARPAFLSLESVEFLTAERSSTSTLQQL